MSTPTSRDGLVLLGTVAIEPNRWGTVRPDRSPSTTLTDWSEQLAALDVDGLELWEGHLASQPPASRTSRSRTHIFNSYVSFDDVDPAARTRAAADARHAGASAVKFNVGNDAASVGAYTERLAAWIEELDPYTAAICECHTKISIAEDPAVAAQILLAAGPADRVQALVHTHDDADLIAAKFDALGERITHVHVNHLNFAERSHPTLASIEDDLGQRVRQIRSFGFTGSWTLEFVAGLLTDDDHPAALLEQAAADMVVLRRLLEQT